MRVVVGSDHAGYALKEALKGPLAAAGCEVCDAGTHRRRPSIIPITGPWRPKRFPRAPVNGGSWSAAPAWG